MSLADAKQDIERIRRAQEEPAEPSEEFEVEVFTCPIEGCNRTVVGEPANLRHYVQHSGESSHRYRTLNEALEIEFDEESYHARWGLGLSQESERKQESIYESGDPWGLGAPMGVV